VVSGGRESGHFVEETVSENVSAGGVFFRTYAWPQMPVGTRVYVSIGTGENGVFVEQTWLKAQGRVVRVGRLSGRQKGAVPGSRGVAIQFEGPPVLSS